MKSESLASEPTSRPHLVNPSMSPPKGVVREFFKQAFYEHLVLTARGIRFRFSTNAEARSGYMKMGVDVFEGINARQAWANWRTMPQNLAGNISNTPMEVIDLCCGTGQSSEVLAYFLPRDSRILGLEFNPIFVERARRKTYRDAHGHPVKTRFREQSVLETFCDTDGSSVPTSSVDLVNCLGAVGHHFKPAETKQLAAEVSRVLRSGGLAMIDSGTRGTPKAELIRIMGEHGLSYVRSARSCFLDPYHQVCFRKS